MTVHASLQTSKENALALDQNDSLALYRNQFHIPQNVTGQQTIYFCGHSLGLQPKRTETLVQQELELWKQRGVEGHFTGERPWLSYHEQLTDGLSELCGALPIEVTAMNSLTVNLHLLLISFYRPTTQRHKILTEANAFASDRYAVCSQIQLHGFDPANSLIEIKPRSNEDLLRTEDILSLLEREGHTIATVLLPGVQYLTGQYLDIQRITQVAQQQGCTVGFDLAHAIGNMPLELHSWNVDFAAWCSYKYLNSGPGAIGGIFVHERHARDRKLPRLAGWWGHEKHTRFNMPHDFAPLSGAEGWQLSNPPIFACAPLLSSLEVFQSAGLSRLRTKSLQLTGFLYKLLEIHCPNIKIITPSDPTQRGCQLSLRLPMPSAAAKQIYDQLIVKGIICDWREPDIIRVAPTPLYNTFTEVFTFVEILQDMLKSA
jgi:kynureninase